MISRSRPSSRAWCAAGAATRWTLAGLFAAICYAQVAAEPASDEARKASLTKRFCAERFRELLKIPSPDRAEAAVVGDVPKTWRGFTWGRRSYPLHRKQVEMFLRFAGADVATGRGVQTGHWPVRMGIWYKHQSEGRLLLMRNWDSYGHGGWELTIKDQGRLAGLPASAGAELTEVRRAAGRPPVLTNIEDRRAFDELLRAFRERIAGLHLGGEQVRLRDVRALCAFPRSKTALIALDGDPFPKLRVREKPEVTYLVSVVALPGGVKIVPLEDLVIRVPNPPPRVKVNP